jgi:hypothetical protein
MKKSGVTSGRAGAKPITGHNAVALKRSAGDSKTAGWVSNKTRSPYKGGNKHYKGCDSSSWGGNVRR